jgi:hypothetical protein
MMLMFVIFAPCGNVWSILDELKMPKERYEVEVKRYTPAVNVVDCLDAMELGPASSGMRREPKPKP